MLEFLAFVDYVGCFEPKAHTPIHGNHQRSQMEPHYTLMIFLKPV